LLEQMLSEAEQDEPQETDGPLTSGQSRRVYPMFQEGEAGSTQVK
jgi:hypothetical protein